MNAYKNRFDFASVIKFALIGLVCSLILGLILYNLTQFSVYQYGYYVSSGLTILSFPVAVMICAGFFSTYLDRRSDALIMGLAVAVLTALLQSGFISLVMGRMAGGWFESYIGNQIVLLIIFALVGAYIGNTYLKKRLSR